MNLPMGEKCKGRIAEMDVKDPPGPELEFIFNKGSLRLGAQC